MDKRSNLFGALGQWRRKKFHNIDTSSFLVK